MVDIPYVLLNYIGLIVLFVTVQIQIITAFQQCI